MLENKNSLEWFVGKVQNRSVLSTLRRSMVMAVSKSRHHLSLLPMLENKNSLEWFEGKVQNRSVLSTLRRSLVMAASKSIFGYKQSQDMDKEEERERKKVIRVFYILLPEELSGVHDTFHVSNLKKCLAEASLHVPLGEIKVDKTLRFVEEPVEIMDREVKSLKRSKIALVKVRWNSKRGPEFTWEREDYMKSKYPQLFVDRADESAS
ncbi:hypothetical protein Tco_1078513 [Tanacetum coccineum]|uniref:Reverse transcriptase domain-containing protein n=1 Tax=Tanacetum coccineum TaxID=301880 RepID=A0ABQ5HPC2_9ASTR